MEEHTMGEKQLNFTVDKEFAREIKRIAFEKDITQKELVIQYIKEGMKRETSQSTLD